MSLPNKFMGACIYKKKYMLSLQTQQNLAVNSLSLASQASQAVLRLF